MAAASLSLRRRFAARGSMRPARRAVMAVRAFAVPMVLEAATVKMGVAGQAFSVNFMDRRLVATAARVAMAARAEGVEGAATEEKSSSLRWSISPEVSMSAVALGDSEEQEARLEGEAPVVTAAAVVREQEGHNQRVPMVPMEHPDMQEIPVRRVSAERTEECGTASYRTSMTC